MSQTTKDDLQAKVDHLNEMLTNISKENLKIGRAAYELCCGLEIMAMEGSRLERDYDALWELCKHYGPHA